MCKNGKQWDSWRPAALVKRIYGKALRIVSSLQVFPDFLRFKKLDSKKRFSYLWKDFHPQIEDKTAQTDFNPHYIYHTAWAARKVREISPAKHVDISSYLYFSTIVSAFIPVDFYDYRPADLRLSNLHSGRADLTKLSFKDASIPSLSCLHTIEHIGLGRYGDPIDPEGDLKAISELKRVLAHGGSLLFVTPVGRPRIQFNAHRIYSFEQIQEYFNGLKLQEFSLVTDAQEFIENADPNLVKNQTYGCGCFWFKKS